MPLIALTMCFQTSSVMSSVIVASPTGDLLSPHKEVGEHGNSIWLAR